MSEGLAKCPACGWQNNNRATIPVPPNATGATSDFLTWICLGCGLIAKTYDLGLTVKRLSPDDILILRVHRNREKIRAIHDSGCGANDRLKGLPMPATRDGESAIETRPTIVDLSIDECLRQIGDPGIRAKVLNWARFEYEPYKIAMDAAAHLSLREQREIALVAMILGRIDDEFTVFDVLKRKYILCPR